MLFESGSRDVAQPPARPIPRHEPLEIEWVLLIEQLVVNAVKILAFGSVDGLDLPSRRHIRLVVDGVEQKNGVFGQVEAPPVQMGFCRPVVVGLFVILRKAPREGTSALLTTLSFYS